MARLGKKKSFLLKCEYFRYHKTRDQGNSAVSDRAVSDREWIKVMLLGQWGRGKVRPHHRTVYAGEVFRSDNKALHCIVILLCHLHSSHPRLDHQKSFNDVLVFSLVTDRIVISDQVSLVND